MLSEDDFAWVDPDTLTEPADLAIVIVARHWWWPVNEQGQISVCRGRYYQGNRQKAVADHFLARDYPPGATQVIQIPVLYLPYQVNQTPVLYLPYRP